MLKNIVLKNVVNTDVLDIQLKCLLKLDILFDSKCDKIIVDNYYFKGLRGNYVGVSQLCLHFKFKYNGYDFEFYLNYDQLEFYISKGNKILQQCNLEDFWEDDILIEKYITHLEKSILSII